MNTLRKSFTYKQNLSANAKRVFPLLCPEMEKLWVDGWDYRMIYSKSGFAEQDCIFQTERERKETWVISHFNPEELRIEFHKTDNTELQTHIKIQLEDLKSGCSADVMYTYTGLNEKGNQFVAGFTEADYLNFMSIWENSLNKYLKKTAA
ncbi:MAG: hypothetical protein KDD94_07145 [Calditrichaeota bacterium]|nr:hypothetical protein [Calditrichota bacterium]